MGGGTPRVQRLWERGNKGGIIPSCKNRCFLVRRLNNKSSGLEQRCLKRDVIRVL